MNVVEHVERAAAATPQKTAIDFEGRTLSYGALRDASARLAGALVRSGVAHGDRVAIQLPNLPELSIAYLAILRAGAIAVSVNALFKAEETRFILEDSGARVLFTTRALAEHVRTPLAHVILCDDPATLDAWTEGAPEDVHAMGASAPAVILYSSGTTGFPKGVTLSHGNVQSNTRAAAQLSGFRASDVVSCFLPLFHVFGQNYIMNACFEAGATLALWTRYVPDEVLADVERKRVTMFFAVPTIYIGLLNAGVPRERLASVRYYFSAAATMPEEISRRWAATYGVPIHEGYGLTECSPCAAYNHVTRHRFGSVGTAIDGFEIRIVDENDREVPRGQWGEIAIRGPGVMLGYWNRPADTAHALRNGFLHSGDIGRMDEDGYVYVVDRLKDMINVSGFKVWPAELENFLYRHDGVKEVAVYGVPDALKGEAVYVAVVPQPGAALTPEKIVAWCRENLAAYKTPARVELVSELPKSATGKILKRVLRERAAQR